VKDDNTLNQKISAYEKLKEKCNSERAFFDIFCSIEEKIEWTLKFYGFTDEQIKKFLLLADLKEKFNDFEISFGMMVGIEDIDSLSYEEIKKLDNNDILIETLKSFIE